MSSFSDVGNLMCLSLDEIDPGEGTKAPRFLIQATAHTLNQNGSRNWVPVIVKEIGEDAYEVIGNFLIYAVAEAAGLEHVWCIIAEDTPEAEEITKVLAGEALPKVNLSKANQDEIKDALGYLVDQPGSLLKGVRVPVATNRISEAPRQYWTSLNEVTKLKCGISRGKKLDTLKQVFYLTPEPWPDVITDPHLLNTFKAADLKKMARKRGMSGYSKMKKTDLVDLLSQDES